MSVFKSTKFFNIYMSDLSPVAEDVVNHFRFQDYEVSYNNNIMGGCFISISDGGIFKSVLGLKTALNIEITPQEGGILAKAGVGIFGMQVLPAAISLFIAWPILITQIWGIVQNSKLDDAALRCIEESLKSRANTSTSQFISPSPDNRPLFCTNCGEKSQSDAKFCSGCGSKLF